MNSIPFQGYEYWKAHYKLTTPGQVASVLELPEELIVSYEQNSGDVLSETSQVWNRISELQLRITEFQTMCKGHKMPQGLDSRAKKLFDKLPKSMVSVIVRECMFYLQIERYQLPKVAWYHGNNVGAYGSAYSNQVKPVPERTKRKRTSGHEAKNRRSCV